MELRKYEEKDCEVLAELFYNTVHTINIKDYTQTQIDAWADGNVNLSSWNNSFLKHNTIVASINGDIVGFGDMDITGYLDRLYVHRDYQNRGIATAILTELERQALIKGVCSFSTHASITAIPFFQRHGYCIIRENTVVLCGICLKNYVMEKTI